MGSNYLGMKNFFPAQGKPFTYLQTNRSDDLGSISSSMNIDLQSNLGTMRVAPRLQVTTSTATQAGMTTAPRAFRTFVGEFYTISGTRVYKGGSTPVDPFLPDTGTNTQTTYNTQSDLELFNGELFSTTTTEVWSLNGSTTWTRRGGAAPLGGGFHGLEYFKKFNRLYVIATGDKVYSFDTAYTLATSGDYSLDLATNQTFKITCMATTSSSVWIGVTAFLNTAGRGRVYEWDGISAQPTNEYILESNSCLAIVVDNDIPYIMDGYGALLKFTGSSFTEMGRLPSNNLDSLDSVNALGFIHPNGLVATNNNTILALIRNQNNNVGDTINENCPSGVWEFSEDFGPTHKHAFTYNPVGTSTITDYGQNRMGRPGALANGDGLVATSTGRSPGLILGAQVFTNATSSVYAVCTVDVDNTVQKKGYFVTSWFNSAEIQDKWTRLWATYRRFLSSDDSIVFKYRLYEEAPIQATITWVNTTSFTTTTDVTAYGPTATGFNGTTGGEVEGIQGTGSGQCAHITSIVNNAGTYTVTVDTAFTGVTTGTAKVRLQKWIKLFPESVGQVVSYNQMAIGDSNTRAQIKGCMTFTGDDEFHKLVVVSNEDIKITL